MIAAPISPVAPLRAMCIPSGHLTVMRVALYLAFNFLKASTIVVIRLFSLLSRKLGHDGAAAKCVTEVASKLIGDYAPNS